ncbi:MAG: TetR/AcrR family transcriptional regulator [Clostridia bacterium]|nr:TetR/AcrR family transcriptional regulator [Clostridia bacterium]
MSDLRVIKTKNAIEQAFLQLREKYPLDKMKVNELCTLAMINKTTFYNYYDDVYSLSEELENAYLKECFFGFEAYDCLITDTERFIQGIYRNFVENRKLQIVFRERVNTLVEKAQEQVLEFYKNDVTSEKVKMRVMFLIHGAFYLLFNYKEQHNDGEKLKIIIDYAKTVWNERG